MTIALRERDDNIVFRKQAIDLKPDLAANLAGTLVPTGLDPEIHIKHECSITEVFKDDVRSRVIQDKFMGLNHFLQDLFDFPHV